MGVSNYPLTLVVGGMPSTAFVKAKQQGRWFEELVTPLLIEVGFRVIDTDEWSYRQKKVKTYCTPLEWSNARVSWRDDAYIPGWDASLLDRGGIE